MDQEHGEQKEGQDDKLFAPSSLHASFLFLIS